MSNLNKTEVASNVIIEKIAEKGSWTDGDVIQYKIGEREWIDETSLLH